MIDVEVKEGEVVVSVDTNKDGQPVAEAKLSINEAIGEAFKRGAQVEGAKLAGFGFVDGKLNIKIDTDKDGEHLLEVNIDIQEALDEAGVF